MSRQTLRSRTRSRRPVVRIFTQAMLAAPVLLIGGFAVWLTFFAPPPAQRLLDQFHLKVGDRLPFVQVAGNGVPSTSLGQLAEAGPLLVLVSDQECSLCHQELDLMRGLLRQGPSGARVVVLSVGKPELFPALAKAYPDLTVVHDVNGTLRERLKLPSVPAALAVGADRRVHDIRFGLQGTSALRELLAGVPAPPADMASSQAR
jgi:hypothetical protein